MKGAAFMLPLRPEFITEMIASFDAFLSKNADAARSIVAFELYDAVKVTQLDAGCFANRGYHLNGLVMPTWYDKENDQICRQWARELSNQFKAELEKQGEETANASAGRRGHKGAVMLYGNYDVSGIDMSGEMNRCTDWGNSNTTRSRRISLAKTMRCCNRSRRSTIRGICSIICSLSRRLSRSRVVWTV